MVSLDPENFSALAHILHMFSRQILRAEIARPPCIANVYLKWLISYELNTKLMFVFFEENFWRRSKDWAITFERNELSYRIKAHSKDLDEAVR